MSDVWCLSCLVFHPHSTELSARIAELEAENAERSALIVKLEAEARAVVANLVERMFRCPLCGGMATRMDGPIIHGAMCNVGRVLAKSEGGK